MTTNALFGAGLALVSTLSVLALPLSETCQIFLRTAFRNLARPFACILSLSAAMMLMTSRGALPSVATSMSVAA